MTVSPVQGEGESPIFSFHLEVDETVGPDRYNAGEQEQGFNDNTDDISGALGQVTTGVPDGLETLFSVGGVFGRTARAAGPAR